MKLMTDFALYLLLWLKVGTGAAGCGWSLDVTSWKIANFAVGLVGFYGA